MRGAVGLSGSTPTTTQMNAMKNYLHQAFQDGAFGMSTGLVYATGYNSTTEELIELAQVISEYGLVYATHMRSEGEFLLEAVDEAIEIGHNANCRVQISHIKCAGPTAWGEASQVLDKIDTANAAGGSVMMDQYPYTASSASFFSGLPGASPSGAVAAPSQTGEIFTLNTSPSTSTSNSLGKSTGKSEDGGAERVLPTPTGAAGEGLAFFAPVFSRGVFPGLPGMSILRRRSSSESSGPISWRSSSMDFS